MENNVNTAPEAGETLEAIAAPVQEKESSESVATLTPEDQLNALLSKRMGTFDLKITYADLKYLKNSIDQKVEWKGPNEAYLVIMSVLSLENNLQSLDPKEHSAVQLSMPASTIESINYFLSRISGKGITAAQRLFSVSMLFRQTMEAIRKLDEEIEYLKNEVKTKS